MPARELPGVANPGEHGIAEMVGGTEAAIRLQMRAPLLSETEQRAFRQLGVFVGGWTLEAAEAVCTGAGDQGGEVLDDLESLTAKSLVRQEDTTRAEPRFTMLEKIHEFAREHLAQSGEAEACGRSHAAYYSALVEATEPELMTAQEAGGLDKLEREHDNLQAALRWCVKAQDASTGLRLSGVLWRLWLIRGYLSEGSRWLEELLALPGATASKIGLPKVLNGAGNLAAARGDYQQARMYFQEALALRRELGDKRGIAQSLLNLGNLAGERGDYKTARDLFEESLALRRELGDERGVARSLQNLGAVAREEGDYTQAADLCQNALAVARMVGDQETVAMAMIGLGILARHQGQDERALALLRESLRQFNRLGDRREIAECLELLAGLAGVRGHPDQAVRLLGAADALIEATGLAPGPVERYQYESNRAGLEAQLGEIKFATAWSEGRKLSLQQAVALALEERVAS